MRRAAHGALSHRPGLAKTGSPAVESHQVPVSTRGKAGKTDPALTCVTEEQVRLFLATCPGREVLSLTEGTHAEANIMPDTVLWKTGRNQKRVRLYHLVVEQSFKRTRHRSEIQMHTSRE